MDLQSLTKCGPREQKPDRHLQPLRRGLAPGPKESSDLAKQLIADSVQREGMEPGSLTIHADNGSSMA